jgi:hypothetical protein
MRHKIRSHLTYANVIASVALFLVLAGASAIAATNICSGNIPCVNSDDIIDGEVKAVDVGTSAVTNPKILGGAVTSSKVANGTLKPEDDGTIPAAKVRKTSTQSIPGSTSTVLTFDAETFDYGALHDNVTNNSRLTAPITGLYQVNATVWWDTNSTGVRGLRIFAPGLETIAETAGIPTPARPTQSVSGLVRLFAGAYVQADVLQTSGSTRSVSQGGSGTHLSMHWLGPGI